MGDHCRFCYVSCLLWQLNSQLSSWRSEADSGLWRILSLSVTKRDENTVFLANHSNFQAPWTFTQKLFNTQLGGEDGIHSLESQTGLPRAGRECKNKHGGGGASVTTVVTMCENKHLGVSVGAQLQEQRRMPSKMGVGVVVTPWLSPALPKPWQSLSSGMVRPCTSHSPLRMNHSD